MKLLNKYYLKIFFALIYFNTGLLYSQDCTSTVKINPGNPGSLVIVDGKNMGQGSIVTEIPKGTHSLIIKGNNNSWSNIFVRDSITIDNCGKTLEFNYSRKVKTYLETNPADAQVFSGDSLLGYSPLFIPQQISSIRIVKNNYEPEMLNVQQLNEQLQISLKEIHHNNYGSFFKSNLFKLLLGSALVLGGTAAYYKLKADDNNDQYTFTKNQSFKTKTEQYDIISGIAFGMLQIDFGIMIYHFLTD